MDTYKHICDCGKICKSKGGLTNHKNKCQAQNTKIEMLRDSITVDNLSNICKDMTDSQFNATQFNAIDLFCGCGGMSKGIEKAGINIIGAIDIWKIAIESYSSNYNHLAVCEDLTTYPPEQFAKLLNNQRVDIIVGGPPCQAYSNAGKKDKNDPRASLFMEYVKYVNYFKPKAVVMENVIGILSSKTLDNKNMIDIIIECFSDYNCVVCKLYASDFEVPQNRRRVIIIGLRKDLNIIPIEPAKVSLERPCVGDVLEKNVDDSYYLSDRAIKGIVKKKEKSILNGNGFGAQFLDLTKPSYTIPARYWKDGYDALVKYDENNIRKLTILELKRIQSFPDDYIIKGSKKDIIIQIGNAVACQFGYHIMKHTISMLK